MTEVQVSSAAVIDALYAADALRGTLAGRDIVVGVNHEAPLRRLFAGACVALACRVDGLCLVRAGDDDALFRVAADIPAIYLETALMWTLAGIAGVGDTAGGAEAVESLSAAITDAEAAACPAHRCLSWK